MVRMGSICLLGGGPGAENREFLKISNRPPLRGSLTPELPGRAHPKCTT